MADRGLLILTPEYPPYGGGIGRFCAQIAEAAEAAGNPVTVVARFAGETPAAVHGIDVHWVRRPAGAAGSLHFMAAVLRRSRALARTREPGAVFCAHLSLSPIGRFLRRFTSVRRSVTLAHGTELFSMRGRQLSLPSLRRQDLVICNSRYTRDAARSVGVSEERLRILHPGAPSQGDSRGDRARGRAMLGIGEEVPLALTVGRMDPAQRHKGHDTVLAAWPEVLLALPDAQWVVAGGGADRARLEGEVALAGLGSHVHFAGWVDDAALADLYAADVFVMPSREIRLPGGRRIVEGFGIVYLEAAVHGLPSIAGRAGGAVDAVSHGETGLLVDPESPEKVAAALSSLLGDRERAAALGALARDRAHRDFDMAAALPPILDKLLA